MSINRPDRFIPGHPVHQPYPFPYAQPPYQCPFGQPCPYGQPPYQNPYGTQPYPYGQPAPGETGQGPCPSGSPYTVQPGDSLPGLASRLGVPVDQLTALNPNTNSQGPLPVGQTICLPGQDQNQNPES